MNVIEVPVEGDNIIINDTRIHVPSNWRRIIDKREKVMLGIRPENIVISNDKGECPIKVDYVENHGNKLCIAFSMNDSVCMATGKSALLRGRRYGVRFTRLAPVWLPSCPSFRWGAGQPGSAGAPARSGREAGSASRCRCRR